MSGSRGRVSFVGRWIAAAAIFLAAAGLTFWLALVHTVHSGTVAVPDLRGLPMDEAEKVCHDMGLVLSVSPEGAVSRTVPPGRIARQEPPPGFHLKTGSSVTVMPSLGTATAQVPPVEGLSLQAAIRDLEQEGLAAGRQVRISEEWNGEAVIAASPPAGTRIPPGSTVDLLVNVKPRRRLWVTPRFLGLGADAVRSFCRRRSLRMGQVHEVAYPGVPPGLVLRQYPPAGSPLSRSDIISLWVSR